MMLSWLLQPGFEQARKNLNTQHQRFDGRWIFSNYWFMRINIFIIINLQHWLRFSFMLGQLDIAIKD